MKKLLTTQKFRFDLGVSFLTMVNLVLLVVTASEKLQGYILNIFKFDINTPTLLGFIIIFALCGTWFFGLLLDRTFKYWQTLRTIQNERDPQITEILIKQREIYSLLKNLEEEDEEWG